MIEIPFDVNNVKLRNDFLTDILPRAIGNLNEGAAHSWGKMSAQHMIEHLIWAFKLSTGIIQVECKTPDKLLPRVKAFLYNNTETPHDFKNPLLSENPPPLQHSNLTEAKTRLLEEASNFLKHFLSKPEVVYIHPLFGPLGRDDWQRIHYKHCYHHLLQFGIIKKT
jgi:oxepin-CoA hydrolase/3-oxo-5,6-dehydrosuberyl-CoA semialdehyde dehydrogenase